MFLNQLICLRIDQKTADECERLIRSYDPCISCSTHFLKLTVDRIATGTGDQR